MKAKPEQSFSVAQDGFFGEYYRAKKQSWENTLAFLRAW